MNQNAFDDTQRTTLVSSAARTVFRQFDAVGLDLEMYNQSKQITEAVISLAESHASLAALFASFAKFPDQIVANAVAVSAMSTLIAKAHGFPKARDARKIALGGLLHDIGMKALPAELVIKIGRLYDRGRDPRVRNAPLPRRADAARPRRGAGRRGVDRLRTPRELDRPRIPAAPARREDAPPRQGGVARRRLRDANHRQPKLPAAEEPREALMYIEHTLGIPYNREAFRALKKIIDADQKAA